MDFKKKKDFLNLVWNNILTEKITKERRLIFMKKNVLIKGILLLIVILLLTMGFAGCGTTYITYPATGTVYVVLVGGDYYNVYMDYSQIGWSKPAGTYSMTSSVSIGSHFFQAYDTWGSYYGYDSKTQYIHAGANYVYLYPY